MHKKHVLLFSVPDRFHLPVFSLGIRTRLEELWRRNRGQSTGPGGGLSTDKRWGPFDGTRRAVFLLNKVGVSTDQESTTDHQNIGSARQGTDKALFSFFG